jgi:hypothetical protein
MGIPHRWNAIAFRHLNSFGTVRHHQDVALLSFTLVHLSLLPFIVSSGKQKTLLPIGKQGWEKILLVTTLPACPGSDWESAHNGTGLPIGLGRIHSRGWRDHDVSLLTRLASSSSSRLICSCSLSSNVRDVYHARVVTVHLYFEGVSYFTSKYLDFVMHSSNWESLAWRTAIYSE